MGSRTSKKQCRLTQEARKRLQDAISRVPEKLQSDTQLSKECDLNRETVMRIRVGETFVTRSSIERLAKGIKLLLGKHAECHLIESDLNFKEEDYEYPTVEDPKKLKFDFFIGYVDEDEDFVCNLTQELIERRLKVKQEVLEFKLSDTLREKLSNSSNAIIILSPDFFRRKWSVNELQQLENLVSNKKKNKSAIVPIWHNITSKEIGRYSPILASFFVANSLNGLESLVYEILRVTKPDFSELTKSDKKLKQKNTVKQSEEEDSSRNVELEENFISMRTSYGEILNFNIANIQESRLFLEKGLPEIIVFGTEEKVSVVLTDIDDLTVINKKYGIVVGNRVLIKVYKILLSKITKYTGRCGDDTFFSILYGLSKKTARKIINIVKQEVKLSDWSKLSPNLRVSCSFGIADFHTSESIRDTIIRAASIKDTIISAAIGMNEAKTAGKNAVVDGPEYLPKRGISRDLSDYFSP